MQASRPAIETETDQPSSQHLSDLRFADLSLSPALQRGIAEAGFVQCTPIQSKTLPIAIDGQDVLLVNVTNPDDRLRGAFCSANLAHTAPSYNMLTDAVTQYLVFQGWVNVLLITGPRDEDKKIADDAEFKRRLAYMRNKLLMETLLHAEAKSAVNDAAICAQLVAKADAGAKPLAAESRGLAMGWIAAGAARAAGRAQAAIPGPVGARAFWK